MYVTRTFCRVLEGSFSDITKLETRNLNGNAAFKMDFKFGIAAFKIVEYRSLVFGVMLFGIYCIDTRTCRICGMAGDRR